MITERQVRELEKRTLRTSTCWLYTGFIDKDGYGRVNGAPAHRRAWEIENGPIPEGSQVLHECDVRNCIRPSHLFLGNHDDNMADMVRKQRSRGNRFQPGNRVWVGRGKKLDVGKVIEIRNRYAAGGVSQQALADEFGVSQPMIGCVVRGENWKEAC